MSETKIKAGDWVRCVRAAGHIRLEAGKGYKVVRSDESFLWFDTETGPPGGWDVTRFEKVEEKDMFEGINVGDTVLVKYKSGVNLSGKTTKTYPRGEDIVVAVHFFVSSEEVESVTVLERAPQPLVPGLYTNMNTDGHLLITDKGEGFYTATTGSWVDSHPEASYLRAASGERDGWMRDVKF